jgi:predicted ATPase/DNA-binding CsgD family transcriptional regulator
VLSAHGSAPAREGAGPKGDRRSHAPRNPRSTSAPDRARLRRSEHPPSSASPPPRPKLIPLVGRNRHGTDSLPHPLTPLLGRETEVAAVRALLHRPGVRLITLTGAGGIGKTRLALQVATEEGEACPNGVAFVELAAVRDPDLVASTIAQAFAVREGGDRPARERLRAFLRPRAMLLVLDNFEHLMPAAPVISELLTACPDLRVIATSRATLRLSGEHAFPVPPLSLSEKSDMRSGVITRSAHSSLPASHSDAVRLFAERARAIDGDFTLTAQNAAAVAEVCRRLDGLPLAIELAAARIDVLSPPALATRLERRLPLLTGGPRDLPARLQTMRDAIAWSYDLLDPPEQALFRRLSVFDGGFTLEAAEAVEEDLKASSVLDWLSSLVEKSLLRRTVTEDETRFAMLETVREYGLEQLAASGEEETYRDRHAAWCLCWTERAEGKLEGPDLLRWLTRFEAEHPNLREALDWLVARGRADEALRLAALVAPFWLHRGHLGEGLARLESLLSLPEASVLGPMRAEALTQLGSLLLWQEPNGEGAIGMLEKAVAAWREIDDRRRLAFALMHQGRALLRVDPGRAAPVFAECRRLADALDLPVRSAFSAWGLAMAAYFQGDLDRASALLTDTLAVTQATGYRIGTIVTLGSLGKVALARLDLRTAVRFLADALGGVQKVGDDWGSTGRREGLAAMAVAPWGILNSIKAVAAVAAARGQPWQAARLLGAAAEFRDTAGRPHAPVDLPLFERQLDHLRSMLPEEAFAAAWEQGRACPIDQAIADALAILAANPDVAEPPVLADRAVPPISAPDGLTRREVEVLRLLAAGRTTQELAAELSVSVATVERHITNLYRKIGARGRADATAYALRAGLVPVDRP